MKLKRPESVFSSAGFCPGCGHGLASRLVGEVAEELGVSVPYAYKIVKELNEELKKMGYKVISGKVSRKYFHERFYGKDDD